MLCSDQWPPAVADLDDERGDKMNDEEEEASASDRLSSQVSTNSTVNKRNKVVAGHYSNHELEFINPRINCHSSRQLVEDQISRRMRRRSQTTMSSLSHLFILTFVVTTTMTTCLLASAQLYERQQQQQQQPPLHMYKLGLESRQVAQTSSHRPAPYSNGGAGGGGGNTPQNWAPRGLAAPPQPADETEYPPTATTSLARDFQPFSTIASPSEQQPQTQPSRRAQSRQQQQQQQQQPPKAVRHIVSAPTQAAQSNLTSIEDTCSDRLCYGLPQGCQLSGSSAAAGGRSSSQCNVLVTSKRFIDPNRPIARDILFELIALPAPDQGNYAAVGFSETGRMQGLVSECLQYRDTKTRVQIIKLKHSYNIAGQYQNVPVKILSGVKNLGVSFEDGHYQCRWIVESAVEFNYEAANGSLVTRREDLGYKNYHILLATGEYSQANDVKSIHTDRVSSMAPISLAQTGHIRSLGAHILIRIHGSLMIAIWVGLVTLSVIMARYYKNEWSNSKINDLAIWFVAHRALMLTAWFGSVIAVIFAYMYTETYHPGTHQISGSVCLILATVQVIGGLFRPSQESSKRAYFNWTHFICGNLSYLLAMLCLVTAAFLRPAHLPPLYIWVVAIFVATYALAHTMMTVHQYIMHRSSKISITPMSDINSQFVGESYLEDTNSPFRQFMLGILVTIVVIFIVILISLVNIGPGSTGTT